MTAQKDNLADEESTKDANIIRKKESLIRILSLVILILLSVILFLTTIMFIYGSDVQHVNSIENGTLNEVEFQNTSLKTKTIKDTKLKIISRIEWLAQPPEHPADPLHLPVPYVIISHTATENCTDLAKCTSIVRHIQTYHMESKGWWDIGYNFLVGGDGYVYEGRGWKLAAAHTYGWNSKSIGISFIGNFNNILPPEPQILAAKMLIEKGVKDGYLGQDYKLFAHNQVTSTQSPGKTFFENIKTWPHWTEKPNI